MKAKKTYLIIVIVLLFTIAFYAFVITANSPKQHEGTEKPYHTAMEKIAEIIEADYKSRKSFNNDDFMYTLDFKNGGIYLYKESQDILISANNDFVIEFGNHFGLGEYIGCIFAHKNFLSFVPEGGGRADIYSINGKKPKYVYRNEKINSFYRLYRVNDNWYYVEGGYRSTFGLF